MPDATDSGNGEGAAVCTRVQGCSTSCIILQALGGGARRRGGCACRRAGLRLASAHGLPDRTCQQVAMTFSCRYRLLAAPEAVSAEAV